MAETCRLFFALVPPAEARQAITDLQDRLALPARPVLAPRLHVTLAFLGMVPAEHIDTLQAIGARVSLPRCRLVLDRLGCFHRAGVAWLGCSELPAALGGFQSRLVDALVKGGFTPDPRPWVPHLTLYRKLRTPFDTMAVEGVSWYVEAHCLIHSVPGSAGPEYRPLTRWSAVAKGD